MDYVEAAQLRGEGTRWIIMREVLPNISAPLIAEFGLRFCFVFLTISALSFLLLCPLNVLYWRVTGLI